MEDADGFDGRFLRKSGGDCTTRSRGLFRSSGEGPAGGGQCEPVGAARPRLPRSRRPDARAADGNRSINMTVTLLGAVLETAVEYEHLASNPARGRRRRVPPADVDQTFLEADQAALVVAAALFAACGGSSSSSTTTSTAKAKAASDGAAVFAAAGCGGIPVRSTRSPNGGGRPV